jgi:hypothetical protein
LDIVKSVNLDMFKLITCVLSQLKTAMFQHNQITPDAKYALTDINLMQPVSFVIPKKRDVCLIVLKISVRNAIQQTISIIFETEPATTTIQIAYNIELTVLAEDAQVDLPHFPIDVSFMILFAPRMILMEGVQVLLQALLQRTLLNSLITKTL